IEWMVHLLAQDPVEVGQVDDHAGLGVGVPGDGDLQIVVVAVAVRALLAVDLAVLLRGPARSPQAAARVEVDLAREADHGGTEDTPPDRPDLESSGLQERGTPMNIYSTSAELRRALGAYARPQASDDGLAIADPARFRDEIVDGLVWTAVFGPPETRDDARRAIREAAEALG